MIEQLINTGRISRVSAQYNLCRREQPDCCLALLHPRLMERSPPTRSLRNCTKLYKVRAAVSRQTPDVTRRRTNLILVQSRYLVRVVSLRGPAAEPAVSRQRHRHAAILVSSPTETVTVRLSSSLASLIYFSDPNLLISSICD